MSSEEIIDATKKESVARKFFSEVLRFGSNVFLPLFCLSFFSKYFLISELLSHFQVFYLCCALFGAVLALLLKNAKYIIIHSILIVYILSLLLPFYISGNKNEKNHNAILAVYQANVKFSNLESKVLLKQIEENKPDIVLLIETGELWNKNTLGLKKYYPYEFKSLKGVFGFILYSKLPIQKCELLDFETSIDCIDALLDWNGKSIRIIGAHPPPPMGGEFHKIRNIHLQRFIELLNSKKDTPTIIVGDLNITPWSCYYKKLIDEANLVSTRNGFGILGSWPTSLPYKIPIDHCLLTNQLGVFNTKVLPSIHSDHLPMLQEIFLK